MSRVCLAIGRTPRRTTTPGAQWWLYLALTLAVGGAAALAQDEDDDEVIIDDPTLFAGSTLEFAHIEEEMRQREPSMFRPVGSSSVVFQMHLNSDLDAAFKPQTRTHPHGDLAEVAAYRIARYLGMNNVAPAVPRMVPTERLHRQLVAEHQPRWEELKAEMIVSAGDTIRGVAIYWIPKLREMGIDTDRGVRQWSRWLGQLGAPPYREKSKLLAKQISNMIAFDYLIGNWDRFSGANAQGDDRGRNLLVRDHNVAFYEPLPAQQHRRLLSRLRRAQRFSTSFVEKLRALDDAMLSSLLSDRGDPESYEPLTEAQRAGVLRRRAGLLSYIAALIDQYGQERVLLFP